MYFCDFGDLHIIVRCKMQNSFSSDQQDEASAAPTLHGFLPNLQLWPEASPVACNVSYRYVHEMISFFHCFDANKFSRLTGRQHRTKKFFFSFAKAQNANSVETV